ncbi:MAG: guanylate kinase [Bacteroidota bacterium]|nr:guanylate kinase [Bacteroidota bacterium]
MTKGKCVVLSAPSGSGKTTLAKRLLQNTSLQLAFSISATSRKPRANEKDGVDYFFIKPQSFKEQIDKESFLEYEEVYPGIFYGTLRAEVERLWNEGKHVIFDIDVEGGLQIKKQFPDQTITIFIMPPSLNALKERLTNRDTESTESLKIRLSKAKNEMKLASKFESIIHNEDLNKAEQELQALVTRFIER